MMTMLFGRITWQRRTGLIDLADDVSPALVVHISSFLCVFALHPCYILPYSMRTDIHLSVCMVMLIYPICPAVTSLVLELWVNPSIK